MAKMTEKFARFTECSADADVAKRVYYLSDNRIRLEYHFGEDRITNSGKVYNKDGQSHILQVRLCLCKGKPLYLFDAGLPSFLPVWEAWVWVTLMKVKSAIWLFGINSNSSRCSD